MFLPAAYVIFACTAILLSGSCTSLAYPSMNAVSNDLDTRSLQDQQAQQCDSLCSMRHAEDAVQCEKSHGPPSRILTACMNIIDGKRDECRSQCDASDIQYRDCLETCLYHRHQSRECDSPANGTTGCTLSAHARVRECQLQCGIQYEIQSQTATDRNKCYTLAFEYSLQDIRECERLETSSRYSCRMSCISTIHVSSDYCDRTFPVDDHGNPVKVPPVLLPLPSCSDISQKPSFKHNYG